MLDAKKEAKEKLGNLLDALESCGIEAEMGEDETGIILTTTVSDIALGDTVEIALCSYSANDYEITTFFTEKS